MKKFSEVYDILTEGATYDGVNCESASDELGNGNAVEVETGIFYHGLVRRYKPKLVWHSGTHYGFDVAWVAHALQENGKYNPDYTGKIITFDTHSYEGKAEALWEKCELDNIIRVVGRSEDAGLLRPHVYHPLEMCIYDSDHSVETIVSEFDVTFPYMFREHCLLLYHDSRLDTRVHDGIGMVIDQLKHMRAQGRGWKLISPWPLRNLRGLDGLLLSNENFIL